LFSWQDDGMPNKIHERRDEKLVVLTHEIDPIRAE
jgi:hypothetical protein